MSSKTNINVLFLGDVVGRPGRVFLIDFVKRALASDEKPDLVVANVENSAHGFGVTEKILKELDECGVRVFSGGNHTFDKKEIFEFIDKWPTLLRPANYPPGTPGRGTCVVDVDGVKVGFLNVMGRVFMEPLQSPFVVAEELLPALKEQCDIVIVDFHAEATAEKVAMGWFLDGKVAAVLGTHTHVQTADSRVLPQGTAYITDVGCCGPADGVIGMDWESVYRRLVQQLPSRLEIADGPAMVNGVMLTISTKTGLAEKIERIFEREVVTQPATTSASS
jgi:2',3'-cyclic-nucleotide 2'-phosphodiesterase